MIDKKKTAAAEKNMTKKDENAKKNKHTHKTHKKAYCYCLVIEGVVLK